LALNLVNDVDVRSSSEFNVHMVIAQCCTWLR